MSAKGLTREVIVSEAVACMEHTGQPTVSLHELARRLGVKPPSLYNHIQNTRQLQREVFRYAIDKFVSHQEEAVAGKERDQAVRAFAQAYHAFAVENKGLYRLIMSIPSQEDDQAKELALPLLKTAVEVLSGYGLPQKRVAHWQRVFRAILHGFIAQEDLGYFYYYDTTDGRAGTLPSSVSWTDSTQRWMLGRRTEQERETMTKNHELFTTMPVGKAVAKLAIPTVVSQIIVILYSLADTFFVGQIGDPNQIAALSITFPIYTLLTAVANLFGIGANSVIARSLGQNDESTAKKASAFAFWASLGVTLVLSVVLALFTQPILLFFGADRLTLGFTRDYLFWVFVIGGLPTVAGLVLGHLVRSVGKTKEAGLGLTIGGVMNIILDPIFIFIFHMDVAGAAVATMLSNAISMVYFFVVLYRIRKETVLTISPKHFSLELKVSWGTLSVGFPAAISVLLVSVSIALLNGLLLKHEGGNILSAAYGVTSKCGTIALHISIGIAQGVMPLIGYNYGAKNHKRVHQVCRLSFFILLVFSVVFLTVVQLFPGPIVRLFIDHAETIEVGSVFMRCWSWCVVGMSLFNMYNSIFQAVGKWKTSLLLAVLRLGVIFSVLCLLLDHFFGVSGLMWVQAITDTVACLIAMAMIAALYQQRCSKVTT